MNESLKDTIRKTYRSYLDGKGVNARRGQQIMIAEVSKALFNGSKPDSEMAPGANIAVIEAGTGTGKTAGYVLSSIPVALETKKKLVISTGTVALQEQLVGRDLPEIQKHCGIDFTFVVAKGRGRYLCAEKMNGIAANEQFTNAELAEYLDVSLLHGDDSILDTIDSLHHAYGDKSWDGDRDNWSDTIDNTLWRAISASHSDCTGRLCGSYKSCAFYAARDAMKEVDCIVANHDLVLSDLAMGGGVVLPEPEETFYVFDEGHQFPHKAVNHFTAFTSTSLGQSSLKELKSAMRKALRVLSDISDLSIHIVEAIDLTDDLLKNMSLVNNLGRSIVKEYAKPDSKTGEVSEYRFENGVIPEALQDQAAIMLQSYNPLLDNLNLVSGWLYDAIDTHDSTISRNEAQSLYAEINGHVLKIEKTASLWETFALSDNENEVPLARWVKYAGNNQQAIELHSAPISAGNILHEMLWTRCAGAAITSATLTALGGFNRFIESSGIPKTASFHKVVSPFDYQNAASFVVPKMKTFPQNVEAHTEEIDRLLPEIVNPNSGTLMLFTSVSQMRAVYESLPDALKAITQVQGDYSKTEVLNRHRKAIDNGNGSLLFGLDSFSEGLDLPGQYCEHVIIAKLPFAVPNNPCEAAQAEWIEKQGGNSFMEMTVPDAIFKLIQAAGRLLRTESDTGTITLLDRRIVERRYGSAIIKSLPPYRVNFAN